MHKAWRCIFILVKSAEPPQPEVEVMKIKSSSLMSSLGADDKFFQAQAQAAAREAQQRWPLFRSRALQPRAEPPPLSEAEKKAWQQPFAEELPRPKTGLKKPNVQNRLAQGLEALMEHVQSEIREEAAPPPRLSAAQAADLPAAPAPFTLSKSAALQNTPAPEAGQPIAHRKLADPPQSPAPEIPIPPLAHEAEAVWQPPLATEPTPSEDGIAGGSFMPTDDPVQALAPAVPQRYPTIGALTHNAPSMEEPAPTEIAASPVEQAPLSGLGTIWSQPRPASQAGSLKALFHRMEREVQNTPEKSAVPELSSLKRLRRR